MTIHPEALDLLQTGQARGILYIALRDATIHDLQTIFQLVLNCPGLYGIHFIAGSYFSDDEINEEMYVQYGHNASYYFLLNHNTEWSAEMLEYLRDRLNELPRIVSLSLKRAKIEKEVFLYRILSGCQHLTALNLELCGTNDDDTSTEFMKCENLKALNLTAASITDDDVIVLSSHPSLRRLIVSETGISAKAVNALAASKTLRFVRARSEPNFSYWGRVEVDEETVAQLLEDSQFYVFATDVFFHDLLKKNGSPLKGDLTIQETRYGAQYTFEGFRAYLELMDEYEGDERDTYITYYV